MPWLSPTHAAEFYKSMTQVTELPKVIQGFEQPWTTLPIPHGSPIFEGHNLTRDVILLFAWVGIPKELLTNQRMSFVLKLIVDLCRLLQIKQIRMPV